MTDDTVGLFFLFRKTGQDIFGLLTSWQGSYTEKNAIHLLVQLCSALKYLHWINIVHRNVKSENCLVSTIRNLKQNVVS